MVNKNHRNTGRSSSEQPQFYQLVTAGEAQLKQLKQLLAMATLEKALVAPAMLLFLGPRAVEGQVVKHPWGSSMWGDPYPHIC